MVPTFVLGDAIGNYTLYLRNVFRRWGMESEIFAENIGADCPQLARPIAHYRRYSSRGNVVLFHMAIGSNLSRYVSSLPDKVVIMYHNITPSFYFEGIDPVVQHWTERGREELALLKNAPLAIADSSFNRDELLQLGYKHVEVVPICINKDEYLRATPELRTQVRQSIRHRPSSARLLFVGRIAPNKRHEDLIRVFYYYKRCIDPEAELFLVGKPMDSYLASLKHLISKLRIGDIHFSGHVSFAELMGYYRNADVFISMSEHEGFCVPLIESMIFSVPILAYDAGAVRETLGDGGFLVNSKDFPVIAEMAYRVSKDKDLKDKIIAGQQRRLQEMEPQIIEHRLRSVLGEVLPS